MAANGAQHATFVTHIKEVLEYAQTQNTELNKGVIFDRPRDLQKIDLIANEFKKAGAEPPRFHGWVIHRERVAMSRQSMPRSHELRLHTYLIRGYYEVDDDLSSDNTFNEMVNDIMDAFIARRAKSSATATAFFRDTESIRVRAMTVINFSGYFVHYAEFELVFSEEFDGLTYFAVRD